MNGVPTPLAPNPKSIDYRQRISIKYTENVAMYWIAALYHLIPFLKSLPTFISAMTKRISIAEPVGWSRRPIRSRLKPRVQCTAHMRGYDLLCWRQIISIISQLGTRCGTIQTNHRPQFRYIQLNNNYERPINIERFRTPGHSILFFQFVRF